MPGKTKEFGYRTVTEAATSLTAMLIRRPFALIKVNSHPIPEIHSNMWLTGKVESLGNSAHKEKNSITLKANSLDDSDRVEIRIIPTPNGKILFDINFDGRTAYFSVFEEDDLVETYLIIAQDIEDHI